MEKLLSAADVLNISKEDLPLFIFSDNCKSFFSWGIKHHQKGFYNHFMWMIEPNMVATQDLVFRKMHIHNYLKEHRLKFCYSSEWRDYLKRFMVYKMKFDLSKPFAKRLYDPLQILGIFLDKYLPFSTRWLQIPGLDICSDKASYLRIVDPAYNLKHPSPTDVDKWMKENQDSGYKVFGRYVPD